jgi:hypothetical protein
VYKRQVLIFIVVTGALVLESRPHRHCWVECPDYDDDWGGVEAAHYCTKCGLIRLKTFSRTLTFYKFYREYLKSCGWGVMVGYDTVLAYSLPAAHRVCKPANMYGFLKTFNVVQQVKPEHLTLSDEELSRIYGRQNARTA